MRPRASPTGLLGQHLLHRALAGEEHAAQADRHDRVPVVAVGLEQALRVAAGEDRVGHHHVEAAVALDGGAHEQVDVGGARGIRADERRATAALARSARRWSDRLRADPRARRRRRRRRPRPRSAGHRAAEARGSARDDDRLSREPAHPAIVWPGRDVGVSRTSDDRGQRWQARRFARNATRSASSRCRRTRSTARTPSARCANFRVSGVTMRERPALIRRASARSRRRRRAPTRPAGCSTSRLRRGRRRRGARGRERRCTTTEFPIDVVQGGGGTAVEHERQRGHREPAPKSCSVGPRGRTRSCIRTTTSTARSRRTTCTRRCWRSPPSRVGRDGRSRRIARPRRALAAAARGRGGRARAPRAHVPAGRGRTDRRATRTRRRRTRCCGPARPSIGRSTTLPRRAARRAPPSGPASGRPPAIAERVLPLPGRGDAGCAVRGAENLYDALQQRSTRTSTWRRRPCASRSSLGKIAADLRLPRLRAGAAGSARCALPAVQVGSSIMPGKVNPVMPELVLQVGFEARGHGHDRRGGRRGRRARAERDGARHRDATCSAPSTTSGRVAELFATRCIDGLVWNEDGWRRTWPGRSARRSRNPRREPQGLKTLTSSGLMRSGAVQPSRSYSDMHLSTKPFMRSTVPSPFAIQ